MRTFVPAYYDRFRCIAGACRHSCCIGWEIDIDDRTLARYQEMEGELGQRVRESIITTDGTPCFRLGDGERCPHLNEEGLCNIILGAGEECLSQICYDHPRFRHDFSHRTEIGLGISCESAAQLILMWRPMLTYTCVEDDGEREQCSQFEEILLHLRAEYISAAQDRTRALGARLDTLVTMTRMRLPDTSIWAEYLLTLERLDEKWGEVLTTHLAATPKKTGTTLRYQDISVAIEQFLVYLLYRHIADAADTEYIRATLAFAVMNARLMSELFMTCETMEAVIDLARMWSSEIEYSTENVEKSIAYLITFNKNKKTEKKT